MNEFDGNNPYLKFGRNGIKNDLKMIKNELE